MSDAPRPDSTCTSLAGSEASARRQWSTAGEGACPRPTKSWFSLRCVITVSCTRGKGAGGLRAGARRGTRAAARGRTRRHGGARVRALRPTCGMSVPSSPKQKTRRLAALYARRSGSTSSLRGSGDHGCRPGARGTPEGAASSPPSTLSLRSSSAMHVCGGSVRAEGSGAAEGGARRAAQRLSARASCGACRLAWCAHPLEVLDKELHPAARRVRVEEGPVLAHPRLRVALVERERAVDRLDDGGEREGVDADRAVEDARAACKLGEHAHAAHALQTPRAHVLEGEQVEPVARRGHEQHVEQRPDRHARRDAPLGRAELERRGGRLPRPAGVSHLDVVQAGAAEALPDAQRDLAARAGHVRAHVARPRAYGHAHLQQRDGLPVLRVALEQRLIRHQLDRNALHAREPLDAAQHHAPVRAQSLAQMPRRRLHLRALEPRLDDRRLHAWRRAGTGGCRRCEARG